MNSWKQGLGKKWMNFIQMQWMGTHHCPLCLGFRWVCFLFYFLYHFHNLYLFACDVYMLFFLNCICFCISYTRLMLLLLPTFLVYVIFLNISITQLSLVSHNGVAEAARKQIQTQTRCFLNEILESTRW